jgi:hypothetical protein
MTYHSKGIAMITEKINSWIEQREHERGRYCPTSNNASSIGDICLKKLVLLRTRPEDARQHTADTLRIFEIGNEFETILRKWLISAGIELEQNQTRVWLEREQISGKIDGVLDGLVIEIKSTNPYTFNRITCAEDMVTRYNELIDVANSNEFEMWIKRQDKFLFRYLAQMLVYLYGMSIPQGKLVFINKSNAAIKEVDVCLEDWYFLLDNILDRATRINNHVDDGTVPDGVNLPGYCDKYCDFCNTPACFPVLHFDSNITLIDDVQFIEDIEELAQLTAAKKRATQLQEHAKQMLILADDQTEREVAIPALGGGHHIVKLKRDSKGNVRRTYNWSVEDENSTED